MANKPAFFCELQKDKFVGGQKGFVDTFNWATQAINNLEGGKNCTVDWTIPDHPIINVEATEGGGSGGGGGGGGGNVEDVSSETYQGGESLKIEYADGSADKHIPLSFVDDVSMDTYQSQDALKIEYSSGAADKYITLPYIEGITINGMSGSTSTSTGEHSSFTFQSAVNSNVRFTCSANGTIQVGVYYT